MTPRHLLSKNTFLIALRYPFEQSSHPIRMEMGRFYFMESFMKEGTGGDNLSIGVRFPDGKPELPIFNNLYLIPGMIFIDWY